MAAVQYFRRQSRKEHWLVLGLGTESLINRRFYPAGLTTNDKSRFVASPRATR